MECNNHRLRRRHCSSSGRGGGRKEIALYNRVVYAQFSYKISRVHSRASIYIYIYMYTRKETTVKVYSLTVHARSSRLSRFCRRCDSLIGFITVILFFASAPKRKKKIAEQENYTPPRPRCVKTVYNRHCRRIQYDFWNYRIAVLLYSYCGTQQKGNSIVKNVGQHVN